MSDLNTELIKAIVHYQQCLEKYQKRDNESRMLYCIGKLHKMPIKVEHLEQTGVGRTVNSLRKLNGEVGDAAKSLVAKWKEMVVGEDNESKDSAIKPESSKSHREESKNKKHKEGSSSSSHKESDKKNKHESKEKSSSSVSNGEEPHSKKVKEESKHKRYDDSYKKDRDSNHYKHKSSKRKQDSDDSESDSNEYEKAKSSHKHKSSHKSSKSIQNSANSDSDDSHYEKMKNNSHKHRSSKQKTPESSSEDESRYKVEKDKRDSRKHKSSKRKREDSDYDDEEYEEVNVKHKKYSEDDKSESEVEEKQLKTHSYKHQSKHRDEPNIAVKEKSKHGYKHKDKKERKENVVEERPKKYVDEHKDKHSSKAKVKSNSEKKEKEENDKKSKRSSSKHHHEKEHKSSKKNSSSSSDGSKKKVTVHENGIGSGSGTSFAEALGMLEPPSTSKTSKKKIAIIHPFPVEKNTDDNISSPDTSKPEALDLLIEKKLEPIDINLSNLLPEITPNYRPLGNSLLDNGQSKNKITSEEEALSAIMYSKITRTKVYSGNKVIWAKVPTLFDLCTHVLQDNIDALEYTGGVPYSILKPVIERANPDQLFMLEHHNPYLIEDTDELWRLHCQKEFRTKRREEMETWRDMYMRCLDEREAKLKALTANIKQSQDKSLPVRQTKLAYVDSHSVVKPPRGIARKQAKHGTASAGVDKKPLVTPSSRLSALATAGSAGQIAVPNPGAKAATAAGSSRDALKVKKAPLMQKTLAFMKNRLFRR